MTIKLKLKFLITPPTQRDHVHQSPAQNLCKAPRLEQRLEISKTSTGQRATPKLLSGCQARPLFRGKENYSSRPRAAKATQKEDCLAAKRNSALQLSSTAHSSIPTPHKLSELQAAEDKLSLLTFSLFLPVMKRTEQRPTQPLTPQISVTNIEPTRPHLADEQTEKQAH